jgi:N-acetyl sugar amidotransferase
MRYCLKCLQPNTRPNIIFVNDICSICRNWCLAEGQLSERLEKFKEIIKHHKQKISKYDAIMGVSGGKDSTRQAMFAKHVLEVETLLVVVSYPPEQLNSTGIQNLTNLSHLGFDIETISPSPITWKKLMRQGFLDFGNWAISTERALFSGVPKLAIQKGIEIVLWGENVSSRIGEALAEGKEGWDGNSIRNINTLRTTGDDWLTKANIPHHLLESYKYPSVEEFTRSNTQIMYLGWIMESWGLLENAISASLNGLRPKHLDWKSSPDILGYSSIDEDFFAINQMLKYYKFGFGRATEYVGEWIREGYLTREQGVKLVQEFDGQCSNRVIQQFCDYLAITETEFWNTVIKFTNRKLFEIRSDRVPFPKFVPGMNL